MAAAVTRRALSCLLRIGFSANIVSHCALARAKPVGHQQAACRLKGLQSQVMCHLKVHTQQYDYECQICSARFYHKVSIHVALLPEYLQQPLHASHCGYSLQDQLAQHARMHTGARPYACHYSH